MYRDRKWGEKGEVGRALHHDWEQTKHDLNEDKGQELNQDAGDTVGQAVGKKLIPPEGMANIKLEK